mmetsp:Transcript_36703/g.64544  ORF Transcript_36703/g.64544 Transcript_36703/m.64544 type:complete len:225 (+) Transcript_36703:114-788(+)
MLSHQQSSGFRNPNLADYASSYYMALAPQLMQVIDRQKQELATLRASNSLKKGQEKSDDPPDPLNTELGGEGKESVDPLSGSESVLAVDAPSAAEYGTMTHPADNQKSQSPNYASGLEVICIVAPTAEQKFSLNGVSTLPRQLRRCLQPLLPMKSTLQITFKRSLGCPSPSQMPKWRGKWRSSASTVSARFPTRPHVCVPSVGPRPRQNGAAARSYAMPAGSEL